MRKKSTTTPACSGKSLARATLLLGVGLASLLPCRAQQVSLKLGEGNLDQAFQQIIRQSNVQLVYDTDRAAGIRCRACSFTNREVGDVIAALLEGTGLTCIYRDGVYLIRVKPSTGDVRESFVAGRVVDEQGEPLIGANVMLTDSHRGMATDVNGYFRIGRIRSGEDHVVLRVSYIGRKEREVRVRLGADDLLITLEEDHRLVSEVVVTGYQRISKERSTASYGFVDAEALNEQMHTDLASALEGKVAGLQLNLNANTGEMSPILRGVGTFSSEVGTQPLIVIDDMPTTMTLNDINPYDVESITVLKDAAAASIYGALAANGVIVVTTKQARGEKTAVHINADWFVTTKPSFSNLGLASTAEIMDYQTAVFDDQVAQTGSAEAFLSSYRSGYYNPLFQLYLDRENGTLTADEVDATLAEWRGNDYYREYRDHAWRTALTQRYNVSLSHRNGGNNHYASFGYEQERGRVISDGGRRFSLYYKSHYAVTPWLGVNLGIDASLDRNETANTLYTSYNLQQRYERILSPDGSRYTSPYVNVGGYAGSAYNGSVVAAHEGTEPYKSFGFNVLDVLQEGTTRAHDVSLRPFVSLEAKFLKMFRYNFMYQYEWNYGESETLDTADSYLMRMTHNSMVDESGTALLPAGGRLYQTEVGSRRYTLRNQLDFDYSWRDHSVTALTGLEFRENKIPKTLTQLFYGYDPQTLASAVMDWQELEDGIGTSALSGNRITLGGLPSTLREVRHRYASFYANANYSYRSRYNLSGSIRWDQADLFGLDIRNQRHPLWSVGGSWALSEEAFLEDAGWLDHLKLRATYGINGNVDQSSTTYFIVKQKTQSNPIRTNYLTFDDDDLPNPKLRWEKTATLNLGVDFRLWTGRLRGSIEYYNRQASDLLVRRYMDPTIGTKSRVVNNGEMRNRGVELSLSADLLDRNDWQMGLDLNFAYNKNKMLRVDHDETASATSFIQAPTNYFIEGTSYNTLWAYRIGSIENGYPVALDKDGNPLVTFNDDGTVDEITTSLRGTDDLVNMGTLTPKYHGSATWRVKWRGFDFNAFFVFGGGHKLRDAVASMSDQMGTQTVKEITERWTTGTPADRVRLYLDMPVENRTYASTFDSWWRYGDLNVKDADYVKLRSVSLGWSLPDAACRRLGLTSLRLRVQADNLLTWCKAGSHIDPESYGLNAGSRSMALPTTYSFGISTSF